MKNRREFLKEMVAGAVVLGVPKPDKNYGPFKMGVQSYCFRKFSLKETLDHVQKLGLHYIEIYPGHFDFRKVTAPDKADLKKQLEDRDIELFSYGVVGFRKNDQPFERVFEFAKEMELKTISADPGPDSFGELDRLVEKYNINIGIHNHWFSRKYEYEKINDVLKAIEGHHQRIGATLDTGHYLSFGEDPREAVRRLHPRIYSVHLKDNTAPESTVVLGTGRLKLRAVLAELKKVDYKNILALEYENDPENPIPAIEKSLEAVRNSLRS